MLEILPSCQAMEEVYNGKSLAERLTGRFYTPDALAEQLADSIVQSARNLQSSRSLDVTDPFCGDGRLIQALLRSASSVGPLKERHWNIELRDRERAAATAAASRVSRTAAELGISADVTIKVGDTFDGPTSARFDIVVTNPPWELLKPDTRELSHMTEPEARAYKLRLRSACDKLDNRFPEAVGINAWGGWGTNLARCGWSLALRICRPLGVVGIVLPSTILADQSSENMRKFAFATNALREVLVYPAEARLFDRVDQPVAALTLLRSERSDAAELRLFDAERRPKRVLEVDTSAGALADQSWIIPVGFGAGAGGLLSSLSGLRTLRQIELDPETKLWLGRELDETRIAEKTTTGRGAPFIKGRMVARHQVVTQPCTSVLPELSQRMYSSELPRAVWRDVSRASQARRMIGTVIPKGWVAGNSLHVACFQDGDMAKTVALHAVLSSFVFEFQVRARLATGHMSLGVVRRARVPNFDQKTIKLLASRGRNALQTGGAVSASDSLEVAVAKAYGLDRASVINLLEYFPKIGDDEKDRIVRPRVWS